MWPIRSSSDSAPSALVVEDEPALSDELCELLQSLWPSLRIVGRAADGIEALRQIAQHEPDIVFLDIQIPGPNGLDVARTLRDRCHVVFVTAYDAHAIEAFDSGAVDYILKPIDPQRIALTVQRLRQRLASAPADLSNLLQQLQPQRTSYLRWITASVGNSLRLITTDEVVFFQSEQPAGNFVRLGFQSINARVIDEGIATLAGVIKEMQKRCRPPLVG